MNWEETIKQIQEDPAYAGLVRDAYYDKDLVLNVERYRNGEEYQATLSLVKSFVPPGGTILDIGAGNGISSVSFALDGYIVHALEPDTSNIVGTGAIQRLKDHFGLTTLTILTGYAEHVDLPDASVDVVFARQAMHHAADLQKFVAESYRVLRPGGIFMTVRDHVVFNEKDKAEFLDAHPLHKYYGGENAFTPQQYEGALQKAGFVILRILKHYDSVINYFPMSTGQKENLKEEKESALDRSLKNKIGILSKIGLVKKMYYRRAGYDPNHVWDERKIPGRLYSYISQKK